MSDISPRLHAEVVRRADHRCEKQTATDPDSGVEVPLFNPRKQASADHFRWEGERAVPLTSTGRATVAAPAMSRPLIVAIRQEETARGRHPPT